MRPASGSATRQIVVLGDPLAQARIVTQFNVAFDQLGIDALAVPLNASRIDGRRLVATLDHEAVVGACSTSPADVPEQFSSASLTPQAAEAGAISAVRREEATPNGLFGALFDGIGFVRHLRGRGFEPSGKRVLIYGAGHEAAALAFELARCGVASIDVIHWDFEAAIGLVRRLGDAYVVQASCKVEPSRSHDLVVASSERSLQSGPSALTTLRPGAWMADTSLGSAASPLLRDAALLGARVFSGLPFLKDQVRLYLGFFAPVLQGSARDDASSLAELLAPG